MTDTAVPVQRNVRLVGGLLGIVSVASVVPAYLVGSPEAPTGADDAAEYYQEASGFVLLNGVIPLLHVVTFLGFLAVLVAVIGSSFIPRAAVLGGGITMIALTAAGFAAEIVYPATVTRIPDAELPEGLPLITLTLALWLYHFAQAAAAVMMIGVALASFRSGALPTWFGWISIVFAVLALLHTWLGIWSAWAGLLWIVLAAVLVLAGRDRSPVPQ